MCRPFYEMTSIAFGFKHDSIGKYNRNPCVKLNSNLRQRLPSNIACFDYNWKVWRKPLRNYGPAHA